MIDFLVHTVRKGPGIHFFYRVRATTKEAALHKLERRKAIFEDEEHFETFPIPEGGDDHELVAIIVEHQEGIS